MYFEQISVFIENKPGRLADVMDLLRQGGIDMKALTVADAADFGIVRIIVDDTAKALELLRANSFTANTAKVIMLSVDHEPGALYKVVDVLKDCNVNIKYMYAVPTAASGKAEFVLRTSDNDNAIKTLTDNGITIIAK